MSTSLTAEAQILQIGAVLKDKTRPLKERFRALFTLKNIGGPLAIECISRCFDDDSALLKHELAYCLGQMQDETANYVLRQILADKTQEAMVRHEAAEALGAIGSPETIEILQQYLKDPSDEVRQTCEIALERFKWLQDPNSAKEQLSNNPYGSVDPAPPAIIEDVSELGKMLFNDDIPLFERYRAMFALRNLRTSQAIIFLGVGLSSVNSVLFRHEIAFVLGQLQDEGSIRYLENTLEDVYQSEMVRHECAEALGAIATGDCDLILEKFLDDDERVVRESCEIALDMCEYENSPEFQYANTLQVVTHKMKNLCT